RRGHPLANASPRFSRVLEGASQVAGGEVAGGEVGAALRATAPDERHGWLTRRIAAIIAEALHMPIERVDVHQPLAELGIDSLIGIELQAALQQQFGVAVSILQWMKGGT